MVTPKSDSTRWFTEQVQPHEPALRAYLQSKYPSIGDVDDVVQESYLKLLRAREGGKIACAKAYLFAIARNAALGIFRKRRVFSEIPVDELAEFRILDGGGDVAETVNARQELALATEAMDDLPDRCREIVMLRSLQGLSHREIAEKLGISEQTVRVQVAKGMKRCAHFLRGRGIMEEHGIAAGAEVRGQRSEARGQRSGGGGRRTEDGGRNTDGNLLGERSSRTI